MLLYTQSKAVIDTAYLLSSLVPLTQPHTNIHSKPQRPQIMCTHQNTAYVTLTCKQTHIWRKTCINTPRARLALRSFTQGNATHTHAHVSQQCCYRLERSDGLGVLWLQSKHQSHCSQPPPSWLDLLTLLGQCMYTHTDIHTQSPYSHSHTVKLCSLTLTHRHTHRHAVVLFRLANPSACHHILSPQHRQPQ